MRYVTLINPCNRRLLVLDAAKPSLADLIDAAYYVDKFQCSAVISNYKNVFRGNRSDLSGARRLEGEPLLTLIADLRAKLLTRPKRKIHPNSLKNLRPCHPFLGGNRVTKPKIINKEHLLRAIELRGGGCSWRQVGDDLGLNASSIRSALRREEGSLTKLGYFSG